MYLVLEISVPTLYIYRCPQTTLMAPTTEIARHRF